MLKKDNIVRITFFRYRNNTAADTASKCDTIFILLETILLQTTDRFSPNSEKMVNFHQGGLLDVVTERNVIMTDKCNFTAANTNKITENKINVL